MPGEKILEFLALHSSCYHECMTQSLATFRRVLVTGGGGFIGSHLVDALRARFPESRITVIDNFMTGQRRNLAQVESDSRVEILEQDLTDFVWLQDWLKHQEHDSFSLVLHFASPASPPRYQAEPVRTYLVNAQTTHQLAQYATKVGARMIFASTSEVYGDPAIHPQPETYWGNVNPNGIRSCYDEAKRLGETILGVHYRDFGADMRLIRIFNTYGPRMDLYDGRVIPDFCLRVLQGQPLEVYGDGRQTRSFCFVNDLVDGIVRYATLPGLEGKTINLGNPGEFTMLGLAQELEKIVGRELAIVHKPLPADDPKKRRPDISVAKRLLNWEPKVPLAQGLEETWKYFQSVWTIS